MLPFDSFESECEFIRNELHDGACQYVTAAMALLEAFRNRNVENFTDNDDFDAALHCLSRASAELRRLVRGLPALHLSDRGILHSVEQLLTESQSSSGPKIEFRHSGDLDRLPPEWHVPILRIVQECLANARRHSHGNRILVELTQDHKRIGIQVRDWGVGFDLKEAEGRGHGLKSIRCRAKSLGGTAAINASQGKGTCVLVEFPLP
jgi:signal transduction histidine kinase